jgi:hypothetical protein
MFNNSRQVKSGSKINFEELIPQANTASVALIKKLVL